MARGQLFCDLTCGDSIFRGISDSFLQVQGQRLQIHHRRRIPLHQPGLHTVAEVSTLGLRLQPHGLRPR